MNTELPGRLRAWAGDAVCGLTVIGAAQDMREAAIHIENLEAQLLKIRNGVPRVLRDEGFLIAVDELLGLD